MSFFQQVRRKNSFIKALSTLSWHALDNQSLLPDSIRESSLIEEFENDVMDAFKDEVLRYSLAYFIQAYVKLHSLKGIAYTKNFTETVALRKLFVCLKYSMQLQLEREGFAKQLARSLPLIYIQDAFDYFPTKNITETDISAGFVRHIKDDLPELSSQDLATLVSFLKNYKADLDKAFSMFASAVK